jgi:hypothetical protein
MGAFLKNIFVTALIVCVVTVASVTIAVVVSLLIGEPNMAGAPAPPLVALVFGMLIATAVAMLTGMFFCILTLIVAAITMPPAIWIARWLHLPRPLVDIVGGVLAAWLCVSAGMGEADSLRQYGLVLPEPIFSTIGLALGGLAGLARFHVLGRAAELSTAASALPAH